MDICSSVRKIAKYIMGGYTMVKEITKMELPKNSNALSYQLTIRPARNSCKDNNSLLLIWKKTILELSQKQGYTGIAL
jgi:hypothetical protein